MSQVTDHTGNPVITAPDVKGVRVAWGRGSTVGLIGSVLTPLGAFLTAAATQGITDWRTIAFGGFTAAGSAAFQYLRTSQANAVVQQGGAAIVIDAPQPDTDIPFEGDPTS